MRAIQIVADLHVKHGGPSLSVPRLAQALTHCGIETEVFSVGDTAAAGDTRQHRFAADFANAPFLSQFCLSGALAKAIDSEARGGAVLHSHGLWLAPNFYPAASARRFKRPLVTAPRGMLAGAALNFSRGKKALMWALAQKRALQAVTCFHATSQDEANDIRSHGFTQPIALVPNGVDLPDLNAIAAGKAAREQVRTVLHLGRLHPKKAIDRLISAWADLEAQFPEWRLRIVGPSQAGYGDWLQAMANEKGLRRVSIEAPVYGAAKDALYRDADLFVLPTLNENFGMVVAEALANAVPVICTKGAPWRGLEAEGCGWWIDHGVAPMTDALRQALTKPRAELDPMGMRGHAWMMREFSWNRVGADMAGVYRWLDNRSPKPDCVLL
jgi:glycosyltransferase involved in cell wall biosynthesis